MTEREPDPLYDALRDRLADYGQEPPAPLWAGIRAQLPPPVAAPQLRRRRRWSPVALLGLLLLIVSVGSWQLWRVGEKTTSTGNATATINTSKATAQSNSNRAASAAVSPSAAPNPSTNTAAGRAGANGNSANVKAADETARATPAESNAGIVASAASEAEAPGRGENSRTRGTKAAAAVSLAAARPTKSTSPSFSAANPGTVAGRVAAKPVRNPGQPQGSTAPSFAATQSRHATRLETQKATSNGETSRQTKLLETAAVAGRSVASASSVQGASQTHGATAKPAAKEEAHAPGTSVAALAHTNAATAEPIVDAAVGPASFAAWSALQLRSVGLDLPPPLAPVVAARADTAAPPAGAAIGRWAVQFLAGPALTYRQLGTSNLAAAPGPSSVPGTRSTFFNSDGSPVSVTSLERPAVGFGAQVQVRRVLNGRWALSTGLGYAEYATSLAITSVPVRGSASPPYSSGPNSVPTPFPDSARNQGRSYHLRNSYRYLTVPVRLSYQLGMGRRLRFGVLAGADVALYLGGATAEYSSCGCETQSWSASGSPYRSLNVALNLGLDVRYRLAPRWDLLAQPSGTYFLTSLDRRVSATTPRYLLGAGALFGVSYGLR
jgi:hypothetical protein